MAQATRPTAPALIALLPLLCAGCITPPAVLPAGIASQDLSDFPPGSEKVAVPVGDGVALRGVFIPAGAGAPVVLHLLPSACSITYGTRPHQFRFEMFGDPSLWDLHQLGCASLVLDYQGVGASDGERSPRTLRADARAAYAEAVRRAGGSERRVVVRGTSIGTLAAATLMEAGATPAAWILFAPVRAETVASNFLYNELWDPFAFLLTPLLRRTLDVSLDEQLRRVQRPLRVFAPYAGTDELLTEAETALLQSTVKAAGGQWIPLCQSHVVCAADAKYVRPEERTLLHQLFGARIDGAARDVAVAAWLGDLPEQVREDPRVQARLEALTTCLPPAPPALVAAALECHVPLSSLLPWLGWIVRNHPGPAAAVPYPAWAALLDLADGSTVLPFVWIRDMAPWMTGRGFSGNPEGIEEFVWGIANLRALPPRLREPFEDARTVGDVFLGLLLLQVHGALAAGEADPARCYRRLLRTAFKAAAIPDRVVTDSDGVAGIEVWEGTGWRPLRCQRAPRTKLPGSVVMDSFGGVPSRLLYEADLPPWEASIPTPLRVRIWRAGGPAAREGTADPATAARAEQLVREGPLDLAEAPGLVESMARSHLPIDDLVRWFRDLPEVQRPRLSALPTTVAETLWELESLIDDNLVTEHLLIRNDLRGHDVRLGPATAMAFLRQEWFPQRLTEEQLRHLVTFSILERALRQSPMATEAAIHRRMARITLRALGVPARLTERGDDLEVWQDGVWRLLPLAD